ncbi:MAG: DUF2461 domain-containing protein [Deltaproteobacteria bacterium]|nr:DUF2461 domain-containing protein [Deltaproteobacteria bacterium]
MVRAPLSDRFQGFADAEARFFKALAKNQNRAWFQAHKADYEQGWAQPMKLLLAEVRERVDSQFPHVDLADEAKVFRIFRDVRFSKDKTPYKTHVAGILHVKRTGKITEVPAVLYAQFGATESFLAAGHYMMDGEQLARYRAAILDEKQGKEIAAILKKLERAGYEPGSAEVLKKVPRGFDPEHPRAELLKRKGLVVSFPEVPKKLLPSRALLDWVVKATKPVAPLVEWLTFATA